MPCVEFRSSTPPGYPARSAGEDDRELGLVVVRDLLARHRLHAHRDGHVLAGRRRQAQRDAHALRLTGGDLGRASPPGRSRLRPARRSPSPSRRSRCCRPGSRPGRRTPMSSRQRHGGGSARRERHAAQRDRAQPVAVQARRGGAARPADAGDLVGHEVRLHPWGCPRRRCGLPARASAVDVLLVERVLARLVAALQQHVARRGRPASSARSAGALAALLLGERAGQLVGHLGERVAPELEALHEVVVARRRARRDVEVAGPVRSVAESTRSAFAWFWRLTVWSVSLGALRMSNSCLLSAFESLISSFASRT